VTSLSDHLAEPATVATQRAIALASTVAVAFYAAAGLSEAALIRLVQPSETTLDWISDAVLSIALGIAVYLWLDLRATRRALTERERDQLVFHTQLSLAEAMQRRLLPRTPEAANGFAWAAMLTPAGRIGGDFFDFLNPDPGVQLMLIADVSGKGIAAAMALTLLRATFRNVVRDAQSPAALASRMSAVFHDEWRGSPYVTAVIARVDSIARTLTYVNAGHPPGLLIRNNRQHSLAVGGPPLGLLSRAEYDEQCMALKDGDVCAFVTDGVTEAFDEHLQPWREVAQAAARVRLLSADAVCARIMSGALAGHGPDGVDGWADDRTVIVLTVDGAR
jgi:serine phosphatase RsbU (regulator of sigma subunit)